MVTEPFPARELTAFHDCRHLPQKESILPLLAFPTRMGHKLLELELKLNLVIQIRKTGADPVFSATGDVNSTMIAARVIGSTYWELKHPSVTLWPLSELTTLPNVNINIRSSIKCIKLPLHKSSTFHIPMRERGKKSAPRLAPAGKVTQLVVSSICAATYYLTAHVHENSPSN
ncbi:hypothetical protein BGX38DRAFT_1143338 [Terfezia claveryi]|nr:hypothetical protein BGX38DRAFT_1143338 [Terfezia claveryi]